MNRLKNRRLGKSRNGRITRFEPLESRRMLSGSTGSFQVLSTSGETVVVSRDQLGDLRFTGPFVDTNGDGTEQVTVRVNNFQIVNRDDNTFTGTTTDTRVFDFEPGNDGQEATITALGILIQAFTDASEAINARDGGGFRTDQARLGRFDSMVITAPGVGSFTLTASQLSRPFSLVVAPTNAAQGAPITVTAGVTSSGLTEAVPIGSVIDVQIDLGDGTVVNRQTTVTDEPFPEGTFFVGESFQLSHTYQQGGDFTVSVTGTVQRPDGITLPILSSTTVVSVPQPALVTVEGTDRDDDIVVASVGGQVIATVNGVPAVLGSSDTIEAVEVLGLEGSDLIDGSLLLPTQSLIVTTDPFDSTATNDTIIGGPGDDNLTGGRGDDTIIGNGGNDTITPLRGNDTVDGGDGADVVRLGAFAGFPLPFSTDVKTIIGGAGPEPDILQVLDTANELDVFASASSDPELEGFLSLFSGGGSTAPRIDLNLLGFEVLEILEQSEELFVNMIDVDFFRELSITGSDFSDLVNLEGFSGGETWVSTLGGNDTVLGSDQADEIHSGAGNDNVEGNLGADTLIDNEGTNTLNGGEGPDTYMTQVAEGVANDLTITDRTGAGDKLVLTLPGALPDEVRIDLRSSSTQQLSPSTSVRLDGFLPPVEDITILAPAGDVGVLGSTRDNAVTIGLPESNEANSAFFQPRLTLDLTDGSGGDDLFLFVGPLGLIDANVKTAPNSGDVIDLGPDAFVTVDYSDAVRAVSVDLDVVGIAQVVDEFSNTSQFNSPIRNFRGSAFDDILLIDATTQPRRIDGGAGTDSVTLDAQGRPVTQSVDGVLTTVTVAGFAPLVVSDFETVTIANQGTPGPLSLSLTQDDDNATLDLDAIVNSSEGELGIFTLTANAAAAGFLHDTAVTEISGPGGVDTLTLNAAGQLVEVVGSDLLIGRLPAVRLFGFTQVTINDAGVPGDYNFDGRVDAADYSLWRDNVGQPAGTLANDVDGGVIGQDQYDTWRSNYGAVSEPQTVALPPATASSKQLSVDPAVTVPDAARLVAFRLQASETDRIAIEPPFVPATISADIDTALLLIEAEKPASQTDAEEAWVESVARAPGQEIEMPALQIMFERLVHVGQ